MPLYPPHPIVSFFFSFLEMFYETCVCMRCVFACMYVCMYVYVTCELVVYALGPKLVHFVTKATLTTNKSKQKESKSLSSVCFAVRVPFNSKQESESHCVALQPKYDHFSIHQKNQKRLRTKKRGEKKRDKK